MPGETDETINETVDFLFKVLPYMCEGFRKRINYQINTYYAQSLPGTPLYDSKSGLENIVTSAQQDLIALQDAGVDAIMFGNENDRPYELKVNTASTATMAYVIGRLKENIKIPFGVNVL